MTDLRQSKDSFLRQQFGRVLKHLGQELVPEDAIVANEFLRTDEHLSVPDMVARVSKSHPHMDASFVRRTMRLLCDLGIAQQVQIGDRIVYEHLHLQTHHDHMLCVRCGKIIEFESSHLEEEQLRACQEKGFQPLMHRLEIRGVCDECVVQMPCTRSLANCIPGEAVEITEVLGGREMKRRLQDLGLVRGTMVRIISSEGPVTIDLRGSRIALGRGQAAKVMTRRPGCKEDS